MGCSASQASKPKAKKNDAIPAEQRVRINAILDFWYKKSEMLPIDDMIKFWFMSTPEVDAEIVKNFMEDHTKFMNGDYSGWINDKDGALAACILLDQWSRNMFRKDPRAFASDAKVLEITLKVLANPTMYNSYSLHEKTWIIMPLVHSEDKTINSRMLVESEALGKDC